MLGGFYDDETDAIIVAARRYDPSLGGDLWAEASPRGTTFTLSLPLAW